MAQYVIAKENKLSSLKQDADTITAELKPKHSLKS